MLNMFNLKPCKEWWVKRDLDDTLVHKFVVWYSSPVWSIILLKFITFVTFDTMELKSHKQVDESCIPYLTSENITLLCYAILKIFTICHTVLFSETPGTIESFSSLVLMYLFYVNQWPIYYRNKHLTGG